MSELKLELEPLDSVTGADTGKSGEGARYEGVERRSGKDRREGGDRREEVRFDQHGGDRRSGKDRRRQDTWNGSGNDRW